jgi:hypothetical protein
MAIQDSMDTSQDIKSPDLQPQRHILTYHLPDALLQLPLAESEHVAEPKALVPLPTLIPDLLDLVEDGALVATVSMHSIPLTL